MMPFPSRFLAPGQHILLTFLLVLGLGFPVAALAAGDAGLTPFEASYSASVDKGVSLNGSATRSLAPHGNGIWLYRTDVDSFIADIDESLILEWRNGKVIPIRYRYRLSGFLISDRTETIDFDWEAGIATGQYRGKAFEVTLEDGVLDPLGYQLQLHQDIKNGKRTMEYRVLDGADIETERFEVLGEGSASGQADTLKAEKVRENSKRETLMWFDPQRHYLLVRLLQVEPDGSRYELTLKQAEIGN
nr:DUF3108 domain-containing protein [uncultured Marinobacter sp.]